MRLVGCYIENFGKWSDRSFSFEQGCNVICQENGWGKSTLAAFIRVMLYGFRDEKVRDDYRNERKRYRPWQGGVYGGRLEFEAGGRFYVISRVFGSREKEDRFSLREKATNLVSHAYSTAVGEELFQLDCNSFCRTVFISQNDCETSVTDKVHAKIGNLAHTADDIGNYEKAIQKLQDGLNQTTPDRKTGSLSRMKAEIGRLEESVRAGRGVDQAMEQLQEKLLLKLQEQESIRQEQTGLLERQQEMVAYRESQAKRERYTDLCREYAARKAKLEQERAYFLGSVPDLDEVDVYLARSAKLSAAQEAVRLARMTQEEKERGAFLSQMFKEAVPDPQELSDQEERIRQIREIDLKAARNSFSVQEAGQFEAYRERFAKGAPDPARLDGILADWRRQVERRNALDQKKIAGQQDRPPVAGRALGRRGSLLAGILAAMGIFLLVFGIVFLLALEQPLVGGGLAAVGGLAVLGGSLWLYLTRSSQKQNSWEEDNAWKRLQREMAEDEIFIENVKSSTEAFLAEYGLEGDREEEILELLYGLKADVREFVTLQKKAEGIQAGKLEEARRTLAGEVVSFLQGFYRDGMPEESGGMDADELDRLLDELRACSREYAFLEKKRGDFYRAREVYRGMAARLQEYVGSILPVPDADLHAQLLEVRHHRVQIQSCEQELEKIGRQKAAFEEAENLDKLLSAKPPAATESPLAIHNRLEEISHRLESGYETVAEYNRQLERLRQEWERVAEDEEDLAAVREAYREEQKRYEILKSTRFYLEQARSSFTSRYTEPVREGFEKYYRMLSGERAIRYHVDANANVTVDDMGMQREPRFLSSGFRDLVGICMRMALVDAMYREEKPFIIFDDPFASLDEDKVDGALRFLEAIGREYQVLYFTCHGSRAGKTARYREKERTVSK